MTSLDCESILHIGSSYSNSVFLRLNMGKIEKLITCLVLTGTGSRVLSTNSRVCEFTDIFLRFENYRTFFACLLFFLVL
jgi:hypothetical protein